VKSELAEGQAMDINQTLSVLNRFGDVTGEDISQFANSDIVVIAVGKRRKFGQKRKDLFEDNLQPVIASSVIIEKYAPKAVVIVVTNPMDTMVSFVYQQTGFPPERIIGMGNSLDSARYKQIIHERTGKIRKDIDCFVVGSHDEDMVHHATDIQKIDIEKSKDVAIETIRRKVCTEFAPAMCVVEILQAIVNDSKAEFPVSSFHKDMNKAYGKLENIGRDGIVTDQ